MDKMDVIVKGALVSVLSFALMGASESSKSTESTSKYIKCYGVAASGKNECGTHVSACAATIHVDNACYAWVYAPEGVCTKLTNASVGKPKASCKIPKA